MKRRKSLSRKSEKKQLTSTYEEVYLKSDNIYYRCAKGFLPMIINNFLRGKDFNIPLFQSKVPETGVIFELNNKTMKYNITEITKGGDASDTDVKAIAHKIIKDTDKVCAFVGSWLIFGTKLSCPKKYYQIIEDNSCFTLINSEIKPKIIGEYKSEKDAMKGIMLEEL